MEFKRIQELREDHDQTQKQMADYLRLHRNVYHRYETGEREAPAWVIIKLAEYYNVSADYILGLSDLPERR